MKRRIAISCAVIGLFFTAGSMFWFSSAGNASGTERERPEERQEKQYVEPSADIEEVRHTIEENDTFVTAMKGLGFSYARTLDVLKAVKPVYDFTSIRAGRDLVLTKTDGKPTDLHYDIGTEQQVVVDLTQSPAKAEITDISYETTVVKREAQIAQSLFTAGMDAGMSEKVILDLAEVFAWNIDFATQVQKGDRFTVLYEERERNGRAAGAGRILAATFTNNGTKHQAYLYTDKSGKEAYYDEKGRSLVRQFLKAPLSYSRVSSGYTNARFHPTLKKTMPHRAIDYAASMGTPVMATADGSVSFAGWKGGYGNFIDIRHNGTYETQYAHLSRIASGIRPGAAVKQGDVIGYVGSTGFSTGPHLHYQMKVNGELVNPVDVELPAGDPIREEEMAAFKQKRDRYKVQLQDE